MEAFVWGMHHSWQVVVHDEIVPIIRALPLAYVQTISMFILVGVLEGVCIFFES